MSLRCNQPHMLEMDIQPTTIERAYQLAASGECENLMAIKARLNQEGYSNVIAHLTGPSIQSALRKLCAKAGSAQI